MHRAPSEASFADAEPATPDPGYGGGDYPAGMLDLHGGSSSSRSSNVAANMSGYAFPGAVAPMAGMGGGLGVYHGLPAPYDEAMAWVDVDGGAQPY